MEENINQLLQQGIAAHKEGKLEEAERLYYSILEKQPNHLHANNNLAIILHHSDRFNEAEKYYKKAIEINPNHTASLNNLATLFYKNKEYDKTLFFYKKVIDIDPNNINTINGLTYLFKKIRLNQLKKTSVANIKKLFLFLFKNNNINHSEITDKAKLLLPLNFSKKEMDINLAQFINLDKPLLNNENIQNLINDELFQLILQKSIIPDLFLERLLVKLRCEILLNWNNFDKNFLKKYFYFIVSLADQCWLNEYIYAESEIEIYHLKKLRGKVEENKEIDELEVAILACYTPLSNSKILSKKLLNYMSANILVNNLITTQVKEPMKEIELVKSIKSFDLITDFVSEEVRQQYEKHPYPRWKHADKYLNKSFLDILTIDIGPNKILHDNRFNNPRVLLAGCGTGYQIVLAKRYKNANILAVDLSLKSLGYAMRKMKELDYKNIEFLHTDILHLKKLNQKFDVIESIGTLHHMKEPLRGLKVLLDILEPHGFLKLGLYSETGRRHVVYARELIKNKKFKNTNEDIKNFRELAINQKEDPLLKNIFFTLDFYSTSNFIDLLFNVQEHRFTIPQISKILKDFNLEFLGFHFSDSLIKSRFSKMFPDDSKNISLDNWHQFELQHPDTFWGMYNFWVRKI
tara:strand:+ start:41 stop:1942 length:1902 start_codon:yes stop_codon:yes gene_type:complete